MTPLALLRSLRAVLFAPTAFFERHRGSLSGRQGFAVAVGLAIVLVAILAGGFWLLSQQLTGTTTIDNPDRPPASMCENQPPMTEEVDVGCDRPATIEVGTGILLWRAVSGILPTMFFGLSLGWVLLGLLLHLRAVMLGGSGSAGDGLAVTAFGLIPTVLAALVGVAIVTGWGAATDLSAGSIAILEGQFQQLPTGVVGIAAGIVHFVGLVWGVVIWTSGFAVAYDIERTAAAVPAVAAGGFVWLLTLV